VRVYPFSGSANYSVSVDVTEGAPGDRLEPNDDPAHSTLVVDDTSFENLSLNTAQDTDMFRVDLDEGESLTAEAAFSHDEADIDLRLIDADEEQVASATSVDDDETLEYTAEASGPYYLVVYPWSGTADYDLSTSTSAGETTSESVGSDPVTGSTDPYSAPATDVPADEPASQGTVGARSPRFGPVLAPLGLLAVTAVGLLRTRS